MPGVWHKHTTGELKRSNKLSSHLILVLYHFCTSGVIDKAFPSSCLTSHQNDITSDYLGLENFLRNSKIL